PFSTIHAFTGDQRLTDGKHKDPRRSRRAMDNIIPTKTGADKNIAKIFPEMKGKTQGLAYRVPTSTVSIIDAVFVLNGEIKKEELVDAIKQAANGKLKGVLGWTEEELVSSDFLKNPHSGIVDLAAVRVESCEIVSEFKHKKKILKIPFKITTARIPVWYDNEWAYAARLGDLLNCVILKM
ncbi:MAG: hypothetical protein AAB851_01210, partial [Patescibacteria group bacterium]